jgi:hypothetical protein
MNGKNLNQKTLQLLNVLTVINFNIAVILLLIVSFITATGSSLIFDNNSELFGPVAGNLRLMLIYLTLSQLTAYCFCSYFQNYRALLPIGMFWLFLMGGVEFYGIINQIPIDEDYGWFFLYLGISNVLYGGITLLDDHQCQDVD